MSPRASRFFGCVMPLLLVFFGCGTCALAGFAGRIFAEVTTVEGDSMAPVLEPGSDVLVFHAMVWAAEPYRGQVTGVRTPDGDVTFRRLVAVPGDTVSVRDGVAYIDGELRDPAAHRRGTGPDLPPTELGDDDYFFLADDRDAPDSRTWGPLSRDDILGEPMFFRPPDDDGLVPSDPVDPGYDPVWQEEVGPGTTRND